MKANYTVYIKKDDGIAVRDADRLVAVATNFSSVVRFEVGANVASAKSLFSVITLDWRRGHWVDIKADGEDADVAVDTLAKLIESI